MQIEAIYDHGRLAFVHPVQFKHDYIRLVVEVPDDEIFNAASHSYDLPKELREQARSMLEKLAAIRNAILPPDDELPDLTPKQLERIEAFELCTQIRAEQGRTI